LRIFTGADSKLAFRQSQKSAAELHNQYSGKGGLWINAFWPHATSCCWKDCQQNVDDDPKKNCFVSWFWHRIPLLFYIFLRPLSSLNKSLVCHCTARQLTLVLFIYLSRYPSIFVANKAFCAAVSLVQSKI